VGRLSSTHRQNEKCLENLIGKAKRKRSFGYVDVFRRIIGSKRKNSIWEQKCALHTCPKNKASRRNRVDEVMKFVPEIMVVFSLTV
jgi:hypothetical protein